ncbi:MAG: right-handed parallel beta-helix repeat-containing protein [Clostridia bacterium]|nr:right-handed parallel beta-helix repeat-containing protein [Clostridia bacterium]
MKRIRISSLLALLVLALALMLSACGGNGDATTPAPNTPPAVFSGIADYTIVYPTDIAPEAFRAVRALRDAIKAATGESLPMKEDFVGLGQSVPTDTKEILVGLTNRAESSTGAMRRDDTGIYFENGRLVITGGDTAATVAAVEKYIATYISGTEVTYPTTADIVRGSYAVDSVTLGGVDLSAFAIVRDAANTAIADYLQRAICEATGYVLPVLAPRDVSRNGYEIVVGNPSGEGRTPPSTPAAGGFVIEESGKRLFLHGDGTDGSCSAVMALLARLTGSDRTPTLSYKTPVRGTNESFSLFSLNLPEGILSAAGQYDLNMTTETVMARFLLAKEALPEEVTVVERVDLADFPISGRLQVYVSPDGDDKNPGTKEAPFATPAAAFDRMKNEGGGIIWMMEGTYRVEETVAVTSYHSGTRQSPLFLKAYEDADVTLTANTSLVNDSSLWHFVDSAENAGVYERLPEAVRGEVMYTKLSDHGLTSDAFAEISKSAGPPKMFVGEEEYTLARYPNDTGDIKDLLYFDLVYDTGTVTSYACVVYWPWVERATAAGKDPKTWIVGWETRIPTQDARGQEIINWVNTGDIWYFGSTYSGWEFGYYNIALETEGQGWAHNADGTAWVSGSDETPYLGYPKGNGNYSLKSVQPNSFGAYVSGNSPAGHNTYYLFNAVEALDTPGEWFLDRDTDILYVYPTEAMEGSDISISGTATTGPLQFKGVQNLVIDGIDIDGVVGYGIELNGCQNVVVQNCVMSNTTSSALYIRDCYDVAVLYSDFSRVSAAMINVYNRISAQNLDPTGIVIQNNIFHDTIPTYQVGVNFSGYRTVVSHNYFQNTNSNGDNCMECIVEYNVYEGGSKDVTDGGMIYAGSAYSRGNHYRYNLIHMFNATHNAIYNDGQSSGNYAYGNMISFVGSKSNFNKGWYSSAGMGNVCYGNIMILRNPYQVAAANSPAGAEDGYIIPANSGDAVGESALFSYHFGEEYAGTGTARRYSPVAYDGTSQLNAYLTQSEAGHWWYGRRVDEQTYYMGAAMSVWKKNDPTFINLLEGTKIILAAYDDPSCDYHPKYFYVPWYLTGKTFTYDGLPADAVVDIPQYTYLDATGKKTVVPAHVAERNDDGSITLTFEEIAAMERFRRQPAVCVIKDNVILGGTPTSQNGTFTNIADPKMIITNNADGYQGFVSTTLVENNFFEYLYDEILFDAGAYQYDFLPGVLEAIREVLTEDGYAMVEAIDWTAPGLSYRYEYLSGTR